MAEAKKIPQRSEVPVEYTWNTADIYPTDQAWEAEFEEVQAAIPVLAGYAGRLAESAQTLYEYLTLCDKTVEKVTRLYQYASLRQDEDTRDGKYQALAGKGGTLWVELSSATAFDTPELLKISPDTLERFYADQPDLTLYRRFFTVLQDKKEHTLSDGEEKLLAAAGEMAQAPDEVFSKFSNADLTFPDAVDGQGNRLPLSNATFVPYEMSEDRDLRRSAYETYYDTLGGFRNTAAALLDAEAKKRRFFASARKYDSPLAAAVASNRVPPQVYRNLVDTVNANLDKLHRYVRLRKKLLGVDELHMYDIYAPMVAGASKMIPFEEAKSTVYDALAPMGEEYRAIIKEGLDNRWIDVYENVGKRSGGYMSGVVTHPYILLNHKDDLDSMFTLAHELGHAVHSYLSNKTQPIVYRDYVIFVAEVASTCNEALLMEHLLARTTDKTQRAWLLNHFLEQFKGTLYRQTMFAEFELRMGELNAQGTPLTAELLCAEYKALNAKYFGPDMVTDDRIALEWARIPHFYYNYYVYQYATGYSAAIALSRRILKEGAPAVKDMLGFLSGGCSQDPIDLLRGAGVDMASPQPVQDALELFGTLIDEMEALTGKEPSVDCGGGL